ncbi:MAG: sulfatase-like hydrolase/transferase [Myxococcales bacterium]|nr:sulfatase-like hydrolase/transferase [Myxococcales bacterium]
MSSSSSGKHGRTTAAQPPGVARALLVRLLVAGGISGLAALVWGGVEAFLPKGGGELWRGRLVAATVSIAFAAAMVASAISGLTAWLALDTGPGNRVWTAVRTRLADANALIATTLTLILFSLATFEGVHVMNRYFAAVVTRALGFALLMSAVLLAGATTQQLIKAALNRLNSGRIRTATGLRLAVGLTLAWLAILYWLAIDLLTFVNLAWAWPVVFLSVAAFLGATVAHRIQGKWRLAAAFAMVPPVAMSGWHLSSAMPVSVKQAAWNQTVLAGVVLQKTTPAPQLAATVAAGSGSCWPDVAPAVPTSVGKADETAPDVFLITVDGLRWDMSSLGDPSSDRTPRLNDHANRAVVFDRAYAPATSTRHSMRSILTGLIPPKIEAPPGKKWGLSFSRNQVTVARYFEAAGYRTIAVVSEKNAFHPDHGALVGFQDVDLSPSDFRRVNKYSTAYTVNRIIANASEPPGARPPLFLWAHIMDLHVPYAAGPGQWEHNVQPQERYERALGWVDLQLDRLLDFALGPDRKHRTVVLITSDHGEAFGEHGNHFHGKTVYEEEIRVPLLYWSPSATAERIPHPVSLVEVTPTLLELAGLIVPPHLCGRGLATDSKVRQAAPVYVEQYPDASAGDFNVALILDNHKWIVHGWTGMAEFYDLAADPGEQTDRAAEDAAQAAVLRSELLEYYKKRGLDPKRYNLK